MLILAATPIGNLGDASTRLREHLESVRLVYAEDTRRARSLMRALGVRSTATIRSLHEHSEKDEAEKVVAAAAAGDVLLLSDAGMPTVSDPGFFVVRLAHDRGVRVTVLPGPSAPLAALAVSGLPSDRFCFEGFIPRKRGERERLFTELARERRTLIFFESANRLRVSLVDLARFFGGARRACVCRELSKLHEEVLPGCLDELAGWAVEPVRGEIVLVVAGAREEPVVDVRALAAGVLARVSLGERLKDVCRDEAAVSGCGVRELYEACLDLRSAGFHS